LNNLIQAFYHLNIKVTKHCSQ